MIGSGWQEISLRRLINVQSGDSLTAQDFTASGIPVFGGNGFRGYYERSNTPPDTVLVGRVGALCGNVHRVSEPVWATEHAFRVRMLIECDIRFIEYLLRSIDLCKFATKSAQPVLNSDAVRSHRIRLPDLETQRTIANFLDRETTRIDQLIEKREAFLAHIEEKKTALIAQTINGSILRLPESATEVWFGYLPKGWGLRRAKYLFRERDRRSEAGEEELLTVSHLTGVTSRAEKDVNMFLAESMEGYKLVSKNDVVINTMWAWMGALGVSPIEGLISPSYGVYAPLGNEYLPRFLDLILRSHPFVAEVNRRSKGIWSSRLRLYPDAFLDIRLPLPDKKTQGRILEALEAATLREDKLADLSRKSLDLLREFRSALITTAVTGEIDVTTWGKQGQTDHRLDKIEEAMRA